MKRRIAARFVLATGLALVQPLALAQEGPIKLGDASFERELTLSGKTLVLNGAAIRYKGPFKVYAVGLYLTAKTNTAKGALEMPGPRRINMVMLRDVGGSELGKNFTRNFEENATKDELAASIQQIFKFGEVFNARKSMKAGDSVTLDWQPGVGTIISINGAQVGEPLTGQAFYNGLMKLWIGDADSAKVKAALLGEQLPRRTRGNES